MIQISTENQDFCPSKQPYGDQIPPQCFVEKYLGEKIHKISYDTYEREIERYDGDKNSGF
jgi:hypothetical protein